VLNFIAGQNSEHKRIVDVIEELDLTEFQKDYIIQAIARDMED